MGRVIYREVQGGEFHFGSGASAGESAGAGLWGGFLTGCFFQSAAAVDEEANVQTGELIADAREICWVADAIGKTFKDDLLLEDFRSYSSNINGGYVQRNRRDLQWVPRCQPAEGL